MPESKKLAVVIGYITIGLNLLYSVFFTPFVIRTLGQSEYGIYTLCLSTISNFSILQFGFGTTYLRYYIKYKTEGNLRKAEEITGMFVEIFGVIMLLTAVIGTILVINIETVFGGKITTGEYETARTLLKIMVFNVVVMVAGAPFTAIIQAYEKFVFQKLLAFLEMLLKVITLIPLLLLGHKSIALVSVSASLSVITLVANIVFALKKLKIKFRFTNFDLKLFREMWVFSFFIFLQSIIDLFNWQIDRFLLARFWGSERVAVYSVGAQFNSIFISLIASITALFVPQANRIVANHGGNEALSTLLIRTGRLQFSLAAFIISAFVFFGRPFVYFFAGPGYENAYIIGILLMVPLLLTTSMDLWYHIARAKNLHKTSTTIFALVAILNLAISIPLCKKYGEIGAAAGTCIGMFVANNVVQVWYTDRVIGLDMKLWAKSLISMLPGLILPILVGIGIMYFGNIQSIVSFILLACTYTVVYAISFWCFSLNQEERKMCLRI